MKEDTFKDFIVDQLTALRGTTSRRMFGGHGLYRDGIFFGIVYKRRLYFRVSDDTVPAYRKFGMKPFRPNATQTLKTYYEVPVDVVEDAERLTTWAVQALRSRTHPSSPPGPGKSARPLHARQKKGPTKPSRS
jgi:DNA transformation protein and related proteins